MLPIFTRQVNRQRGRQAESPVLKLVRPKGYSCNPDSSQFHTGLIMELSEPKKGSLLKVTVGVFKGEFTCRTTGAFNTHGVSLLLGPV